VEQHRQPRLLEHLVERVGQSVVGEELLQRRMELQSADVPAGDQAARLAYRLVAPVRVQADEGERHIGVFGREVEDRVVPDHRPPAQPSSTVNTTQARPPTAIVLGERAPAGVGLGAEVLAGRSVRLAWSSGGFR
jgi:hypothetical protein